MDVSGLLARRRMTRSFRDQPVDTTLLRTLCATALWAPTAGNTAGIRFTIIPASHTDGYFAVATDAHWRETAVRAPGLMRAGAVILVTCQPNAYLERYREPDKASSGLGERASWPLPYWHTDAAMATMALLLLLEEADLGATMWGSFRNVPAILTWAGCGDEELFASLLIGYPDNHDYRSASLERVIPTRAERVRLVGEP